MNLRLMALMLGLITLTACQGKSVSPMINTVSTGGAITAEGCKSTLKGYVEAIETHPEKYKEENPAIYPEMAQFGKDIAACQEKGFLTFDDMTKVAEQMEAEDHGGPSEAE